jgi:hypothetical protein
MVNGAGKELRNQEKNNNNNNNNTGCMCLLGAAGGVGRREGRVDGRKQLLKDGASIGCIIYSVVGWW